MFQWNHPILSLKINSLIFICNLRSNEVLKQCFEMYKYLLLSFDKYVKEVWFDLYTTRSILRIRNAFLLLYKIITKLPYTI